MSRSRLPEDLIEKIIDLEKRISDLESVSRMNNTSVDSGEFTLSGGDLVIKDSAGNKVLEIVHGTEPVIAIYPSDENTFGDKIVLTGSSSLNEGVELQASIQQAGNVQDGGKFLLKKEFVSLGHTPDTDPETSLTLGLVSNIPQSILMKGRWLTGITIDPYQAVVADTFALSSGFSSLIVTYDRVMNTQMIPLVALLNALGPVSWSLTDQTSAGFTVAWSGTDAKTISYWSFRI